MEYMTHEILKIRVDKKILPIIPDWAQKQLEAYPYVVVRRVPVEGEGIPIGIRGESRDRRQAAYVKEEDILSRITPRDIVAKKSWRTNLHFQQSGIAQTLEGADKIFESFSLPWGPIGSTGFQLACSFSCVNAESDLDIALYCTKELGMGIAQKIMRLLSKFSMRIDALIETPNGAVSLSEYATSERGRKVLLRTLLGPKLVRNPWNSEKWVVSFS
jgi:phosphoribosyl-dephospho-CoA transferase